MDASSRTKSRKAAPHPLVVVLDDLIAAVEAGGLSETGELLRISRLDLVMRLHDIKAEELELLAYALARESHKAKTAQAVPCRRTANGRARAVCCRGGKQPKLRR